MTAFRGGASDGPVLALRSVSKRFGDMAALDAVDFALRAGTVHGLVGENGAGKTTLMRIAFGLLAPDSGTIQVGGQAYPALAPGVAIAHGIGMVHQHYLNVPALTVAENIALGGRGPYDTRRGAAAVRELSVRIGAMLDPDATADSLSVADQQRLEIVKALARDARILILDEPTAVLAPREAQELFGWLRGFVSSGGAAVLITHRLADVVAVTDEVTVLRHGRRVVTSPTGAMTSDAIAGAMLGGSERPPRPARPGPVIDAHAREPVAVARNVSARDVRGVARVHGASFDIHRGELIGVAGVDGSGHHELLSMLAGRLTPVAGDLQLPSRIGFVPENRQRDALIPDFSVAENLALRGAASRRGALSWAGLRRDAANAIAAYDIRGAAPDTPIRHLSGGNQQKLVLARELRDDPMLIVAESPTQGLDIRASAAILDRLLLARSGGAAVVVYSSDLDELVTIATRLFVMHGGRLRETPVERGAAGRAMLGAA